MKRLFAEVIAHDMRNPLTGLSTALSVVKGELPHNNPFVEAMEGEIHRMAELISEMVAYANTKDHTHCSIGRYVDGVDWTIVGCEEELSEVFQALKHLCHPPTVDLQKGESLTLRMITKQPLSLVPGAQFALRLCRTALRRGKNTFLVEDQNGQTEIKIEVPYTHRNG